MKSRSDTPVVELVFSSNPFAFAELVRAVADTATRLGGWQLIATPVSASREVEALLASRADALLTTLNTPQKACAALECDRLVVNLIGHVGGEALPVVLPDEYRVGRCGAEHLLQHRSTTLVFCGVNDVWSLGREAGFAERVEAAGREPEVYRIKGSTGDWLNVSSRAQWRQLGVWLCSLPRPIGLMACNDQLAVGLLNICEQTELRVPEDVAILGVDNHELRCEYSRTSLSSIDLDYPTLGATAAELLHRKLRGLLVSIPRVLVPPRGAVGRKSTRPPITDPDVARALSFLQENLQEPLRVDDIANHVNLSRSTLERRFQQQLGQRPGEALRVARLAHAGDLLRQTNLPLLHVALASGFSSQSYFNKTFRKRYGMTPTAYRLGQHRQLL